MLKISLNKTFLKNFAALFAGALLPLAFAPFSIYSLAILITATLLFLWLHTSPRKAALHGFLFGLGYFGIGTSWVYISIHDYGHSPVPLAFLITALLIIYMSSFPALQGYLLTKFFPHNSARKLLLAYPASWALIEWLREWLLTGFPWLSLGYSQISSPLRSIAPIFGVYGVTFITALVGGALIFLYINKKPKQRLIMILALFLLWFICEKLNYIDWTKQIGDKIKVSIIQGNIPQEMKWQPEQLSNILQSYLALTEKHWNSSIIVWPEAAIPIYPDQIANFLKNLAYKAREHKSTIFTGIPLQDKVNHNVYYNGLISLGINEGQYAKRHLVPFGEYVPFDHALHGLLDVLKLPMSNFSSGSRQQTPLIATTANIKIAPFICYEIAYPSLVLDNLPEANILLTISDDSWFGQSIALAQHLEIAQMRSLEAGRYQLVAANTGLSAIIDSKGKIVVLAPIFKQSVIDGNIEAMQGKTPWVSWGQYCWWWLAILCLIIAKISYTSKKFKCHLPSNN